MFTVETDNGNFAEFTKAKALKRAREASVPFRPVSVIETDSEGEAVMVWNYFAGGCIERVKP